MTTTAPHVHPRQELPSDDPRVQLDEAVGVFEPVPPYPPPTTRITSRPSSVPRAPWAM